MRYYELVQLKGKLPKKNGERSTFGLEEMGVRRSSGMISDTQVFEHNYM